MNRRQAIWAGLAIALVVGAVVIVSTEMSNEPIRSVEEVIDLGSLLPKIDKDPIRIVNIKVSEGNQTTYISQVMSFFHQAGLQTRSKQSSPDPKDVFIEMWNRNVFVTSVYRNEVSPNEYTIFFYATGDEAAKAAVDILLANLKLTMAKIPHISISQEK